MDKNKGGRPAGSFKGKEKKIKTSVAIEPRFRRAIVERYASFQEWFDAQVQREFSGEDIPVLSSEDAERDEAMERADLKLEPVDISKSVPALSEIVITPEQIKQSRQVLIDSGAVAPHDDGDLLEVGGQPVQLVHNSQLPESERPKGIIQIGKPVSQEELDRIKETFQTNLTGPEPQLPALDPKSVENIEYKPLVNDLNDELPPDIDQAIDAAGLEELADMNKELDALEGEDPEDESNLDPFNQL